MCNKDRPLSNGQGKETDFVLVFRRFLSVSFLDFFFVETKIEEVCICKKFTTRGAQLLSTLSSDPFLV